MKFPIQITPATREQLRPKPRQGAPLGFGTLFTDHMFLAEYAPDKGWHSARVEPYQSLTLDPATLCFHYAQLIFEGLKAYRNERDEVYLFRWRKNAERLNRSAERLCMPPLEPDLFGEGIREVIRLDRDWIPTEKGWSLYLRPVMMATECAVGVRASSTYLFYVIASPVGPYHQKGFGPVNIWVSDADVRAAVGGTGDIKCAANYASGLRSQKLAKANGCDHVLWLDARERKYIEEVGTMNIFFLIDGVLVTPPLAGTILPGVTRDSVIQLARGWGIEVQERAISIDEVFEAIESGRMQESFGTGTAAAISPVGALSHRGRQATIGTGAAGPVSLRLFDSLISTQRGDAADSFGWSERVLDRPQ